MKKKKIASGLLLRKQIRVDLDKFKKVKLSGTTTLDDGTVIEFDTDTLEVGSIVKVKGEDGAEPTLIADGEYVTDEGVSFTVAGGIVVEMSEGGEGSAGGDEFSEEHLSAFIEAASDMVENIIEAREKKLRKELQAALTAMGAKGINLMAEDGDEDDDEDDETQKQKKFAKKFEFKVLSQTEIRKMSSQQRVKYMRELKEYQDAQKSK